MRKSRGDTLVEVLFATAIGGMIIMLAITLMNRNLATIQQAVEETIVRQNIDTQAELLRYLTDSYKASRTEQPGPLFQTILDEKRIDPSPGATPYGSCDTSDPSKAFYLQADNAAPAGMRVVNYNNDKPDTYAQPGRGLWVEAVGPVPADEKANYIDFHIRACWPALSQNVNSTMGTIVRLFYVTGDNRVVYNGSPATLTSRNLRGAEGACLTNNCTSSGGSITSSWAPFAVKYSPTGLQSGNYVMTINYSNNSAPDKYPPAPYKYKVNLTIGGRPGTTPLELDPQQSSQQINLGPLDDTSSFALEWTNDAGAKVDPAGPWTNDNILWDANFRIDSVSWEKK